MRSRTVNIDSEYLQGMPKIELHIHVEGTIEGQLLFEIADRNGINLPYDTPDDILALQNSSKKSDTESLKSFLECLDASRSALRRDIDYYEIAMSFYTRAERENIRYVEIMFDPQQAVRQGVPFEGCIEALCQARDDARDRFDINSQWIMNFQRDFSLESAIETLSKAETYREEIVAVGLDNFEIHDFPRIFVPLFDLARAQGYHLTSHCDVHQPNSLNHIRDCLDLLKVERLDHGLDAFFDESLCNDILERDIGVAACPTFYSKGASCPQGTMECIRGLLEIGVLISLSSDDPVQLGSGWLTTTLTAAQSSGGFSNNEMKKFMINAVKSSWMENGLKASFLSGLNTY